MASDQSERESPPAQAAVAESTPIPAEALPTTVTAQPENPGFLVAMTDEHGLGAEKFRVLATRLSNPKITPRPKVIQVTSSIEGEGKTLVSCNLAVTLAKRSGQTVLLLEGDLRKPAACQMFGLSLKEGIGEWWQQEEEESSILPFLRHLDGTNLYLLPAGSVRHPVAVLQSGRMAGLIKQLAGWFDWVVIDSPPVLPMADANLWSRLADGTLFVIREGVVQRPALQAALDSLDSPKLLGTVLNDAVDFDRLEYYGRYGYSQYFSKDSGSKRSGNAKRPGKTKRSDGTKDSASTTDTGKTGDTGSTMHSDNAMDAGSTTDAGGAADSGITVDPGSTMDTGGTMDSDSTEDSASAMSSTTDLGSVADSGSDGESDVNRVSGIAKSRGPKLQRRTKKKRRAK